MSKWTDKNYSQYYLDLWPRGLIDRELKICSVCWDTRYEDLDTHRCKRNFSPRHPLQCHCPCKYSPRLGREKYVGRE